MEIAEFENTGEVLGMQVQNIEKVQYLSFFYIYKVVPFQYFLVLISAFFFVILLQLFSLQKRTKHILLSGSELNKRILVGCQVEVISYLV